MGVFLDSFIVVRSFHPISSWNILSLGHFSVLHTICVHRFVRIKIETWDSRHMVLGHFTKTEKIIWGNDPRSKVTNTRSYRILQERSGKVTASCRKAPEIAGTWKQYSHRKFIGFFPVNADQFLVLSGRDRSEIIGKNLKSFQREYCFHVPAIYGAFLPEPARIFRPGTIVRSP